MSPIFLDKASYWVNLAYIGSVSLTLVVSVLAVFISQQRAAVRDAELKKVQADSAQQVALANERTASAAQHTAEANVVVAQAESRTAAATRAQEELRKQNLVLSVQLEQERKLRAEAEERAAREAAARTARTSAPRKLTANQMQVIASTLRPFAGKHVTIVELVDPEAGPLAQQLTAALSQAQWSPVVSRFGALTPPQFGIVCTHSGTDKAAIALVETLRSFNLTVYERKAEGNSTLELLVGLNGPANSAQ
ncbi:MAG TPA: hypothetical protein VGK48_16770 [Terriglobia bacterium]